MSFGSSDGYKPAAAPKALGVDRTRLSTNEQARPVPIAYGSKRFGATFISELFDKKISPPPGGTSSGKGAVKTSDRLYYAAFACLICAGPAYAVPRIVLNDEVIYSAYVPFGDDDFKDVVMAKGRHTWTARFYKGSETQTQDSYLITKSGVQHPAYRGWHYAVFHQMLFGLNQTDAPNVEFEPYIVPEVNAWFTADVLPHTLAFTSVNPIAIIADTLQNKRTGLAVPDALLDTAALDAAAATLMAEKQVLAGMFDRAQETRSLVDQVLAHVDGYLTVNGEGQLGVGLNRPPADLGALPIVDEDVMVRRPARTSANWLNAQSETRLRYSKPGYFSSALFNDVDEPPYEKNLVWRDRGLLQITDEPSSVNVDRTLIRDSAVAQNTVTAIGRRNAVPTSKGSVSIRKVNGLFAALTPGALFKLRLPSRGITEQICRVEVRTDPSPGSPSFSVSYVVDYSWLNTAGNSAPDFTPGEGGGGEDPAPDATFAAKRIVELPIELCPDGKLSLAALVRRDNVQQDGFAVWAEKNFAYAGSPPDSFGFLQVQTHFALHGKLGDTYAAGAEVDNVGMLVQLDGVDLTIDEQTDWDAKSNNLLVFVEDEIVSVHTVELVESGWYRLYGVRGRFGTTNVEHAADAEVFIIDRRKLEPLQHPLFVAGYEASLKLAPIQAGTQADLASVTATAYTIVRTIALSGIGSPEGVVTAVPGTHYWQTDTGTDWVKDTGVGNTGWVVP